MPTSNDGTAHRIFVRILQAVACIAMLAIANVGVTLALEPYGTSTEVVWWSFRDAADEDIDTIFCGTSFAEAGFAPYAFDETAGSRSWTLATSAQTIENSERAIREAARQHTLKRVIIGIGYSTLRERPWVEASSTFVQAMSIGSSPQKALANYVELTSSEAFFPASDSFSLLFPWSFSNVGFSFPAILDNISNRLTCANPLEAGQKREPGWTYGGQGYYYVSGLPDLERLGNEATPATENDLEVFEPNLASLESIARFCKDRDIQLYIVGTPMTPFNVLKMGRTYAQQMQQMKDRVEAEGAICLDFNMTKGDFYTASYDEFNDADHLNHPGAERFSAVLGKLISRIEAGNDISGEFYSYAEWDTWRRSLDHISVIGARGQAETGGVAIETWAWGDPEIDVEYRISSCDEDGAVVEILTDWSEQTSYHLPMDNHGMLHVMVEARRASEPDVIERICRVDIPH